MKYQDKLKLVILDAIKKPFLVKKFFYAVKAAGVGIAVRKVKSYIRKKSLYHNISTLDNLQKPTICSLNIVPYYFDETKLENTFKETEKLAVHIYANSLLNLEIILKRLQKLHKFDLYLSVAKNLDQVELRNTIAMLNLFEQQVNIELVDESSNGVEHLIFTHGKKILDYKYLGHFNTNFTETDSLDLILDAHGINTDSALSLLKKDGRIVYPESKTTIKDPSGWNGYYESALLFFQNHATIEIQDLKSIDFSASSIFWTKTECLNDLFNLHTGVTYSSDFLNNILLVLVSQYSGKSYCIYGGDVLRDYIYYEEQQDYSSTIKYKNIKVLSYYLGQFHPIPENDEWHGKGFTEWTNVKRAFPLFDGHYQQHIPHENLGYYMLDNPDILKKQADMMKKSGVYGQIIYHYWFTGKLILEKPAKMLLDNKDIDMPFCFCWANENWTKRWDGEDDNILLGQVYSKEDARAFIQYLIPFFKDSRYIQIENRPALYIYRSLSIPNPLEYIEIWGQECRDAGLPTPYLVTVLTRGATNPNDFGMDAGVERVLFDWTDGAVPDIKNTLNAYNDLFGSVIDYSQVANFYEKQLEEKNFTYFRSIVPQWDNTARYHEGAYALHKSTPQRFQKWFEKLIKYTEKTLEAEKQFIIVNAWNEWAEGAHLEPDTCFGFSYLNSIGRALSDMNYGDMPANDVIVYEPKKYS